MEEVAISSSKGLDGFICVWDLRTGTVLNTYKPNSSDTNCVDVIRNEFVVSSQNNSTTLSFWSLKKIQPIFKSTPPERITSLRCSKDGLFCVGGGVSGSLNIWEVSSGTLLRSWEGHYKKVNTISFTDDDSFVLTGGEDAIINVWNLALLLSNESTLATDSSTSSQDLKPFVSWSQHSLPITHIYCGYGGVNSRVVSSSLDRTCKIWDIPSGSMICSIIFPTGLTCIAMDPSERFLFVGGMDSRVFQMDLFSSRSISEETLFESSQLFFQGHTQGITSLAVSFDGNILLSSSEDGTCKSWDIFSRQQIQSFNGHKGPVSNVSIMIKTPNWINSADKKVVPLVQSFKKYVSYGDNESDSKREVPIALSFTEHDMEIQNLESYSKKTILQNMSSKSPAVNPEVANLKKELETLKEENSKWKQVNNELYRRVSQSNK